MMLGMAYTLLDEDLYDRYFVENCCVGFEHLAQYLRGEIDGMAKTPQWAAKVCDIPYLNGHGDQAVEGVVGGVGVQGVHIDPGSPAPAPLRNANASGPRTSP